MSFQAYIDNIQAKTGKSPDNWSTYAAEQGWLENGALCSDVKAGAIVADLKDKFALGHGHAMAIVALLKGKASDDC